MLFKKDNVSYFIEHSYEIQHNDTLVLEQYAQASNTNDLAKEEMKEEDFFPINRRDLNEEAGSFSEIQYYKDTSSTEVERSFEESEKNNLSHSINGYSRTESEISSEKRSEYELYSDIESLDESKNSENNDEINIEDISKEEYETREDLSEKMKKWAAQKKFKLSFDTSEKRLVKEDCYVSRLNCSKKDCAFFLEFKTQPNKNINLQSILMSTIMHY